MVPTQLSGGITFLACLGMAACSAAPVSTGSHNPTGSSGAGNNGGNGYVPLSTGGAPVSVVDGGRPPRCDDAGKCTCINIAEFGNTGQYGAVQGQDKSTAFQLWLNSMSTAHVDVFTQRIPITVDLLSNYDVIILQSLSNNPSSTQQSDYWSYAPEEIATVQDWVQTKGGAIIALTGYFSDNSFEIGPTNQLISFSGITYNADDIILQPDCPLNPASNNQQTCYCWGNSIPITAWNPSDPISKNVPAVGAFRGRSINAPSDASIVATFNETSGPLAGHTYNVGVSVQKGNGRVFAYGDEWITYNSQWDGSTLTMPATSYDNPYDPCYNQRPTQVFNIPQLWYNALKWCAPLVSCLTITTTPEQQPIVN